ncbi:MAG: pilus assembly FimT family protein, partial [Planctomycetota bacterium]
MRTPGLSARPPGREAGGFTIIELLIAILIVMILAGLTAPAVGRGIRQSRMNSAAARVATALKRARNLAITKGHIHCAAFGTNDIVIWEIVDEGASVPGAIPTPPAAGWERAGGVKLPEGTVLAPSQAFIAFMPDGSAWGPGMLAPQEFMVTPEDPGHSALDK